MALGGVAPFSALVEVNAGVPVQVAFPGANRLKVTLPVGVCPPLTVAVSEMATCRPARRSAWPWSRWSGRPG